MAAAMGPCSDSVTERWLAVLNRVHPDYAAGVRHALENPSDVNAVPVTDDTKVRGGRVTRLPRNIMTSERAAPAGRPFSSW